MPVISIVSNVAASQEAKLQLLQDTTLAVAEILRTPNGHVHVHIQDSQLFSFGGDATTPAAWVTIQASSRQILEVSRKYIIDAVVPLLQTAFGCDPNRTTTFFVEHPVENIAVGNQIMLFSSPGRPSLNVARDNASSGPGSPLSPLGMR